MIEVLSSVCQSKKTMEVLEAIEADRLRCQFLHVLHCRRSAQVPLTVEPGRPVLEPMYQETPRPPDGEEMQSCPKENHCDFKELLKEENLCLITEEGEQGRVPVLVLSMKESNPQKRPAIVFLHRTNTCKEWLRPLLEAYASRGYIAVAIDSRYHGERASSPTAYQDALVSAWKTGDTMPFIYDTVWDLIKVADYLTERDDIDPSRIGITGESLGGMHAWFAAVADTRYSVVVPIIGVQVWDKIAPGLASQFDAPYTIPIIAPRPLLILTGEKDARCPLQGLRVPQLRAVQAYENAGCPDKFKMIAERGIWHRMTPSMVKETSDWFDRYLR
ncbi:uncharacterized protein LOC108203892 isoform X3 [Daucus carota subsp. sativus]|uniref:uncharacterized protein LOC108203892 isoform X3 n=1 Tax=Daucus carota subsp. sativus TaxID=79200 RepID=UPI0007F01B9E|nr:PREDICTED: uncharacterized protein LOC108203892 isoform X3 [Daucus carota subsp. sativus]